MTQSDRTPPQALALPARRGPPRAIRTRFFVPQGNYAPIAAINTTPLVDVMLVLLIMFIMIIPVVSHKVPLDLPAASAEPGVPPPIHRLDVTAAGALLWDGASVSAASLPGRLSAMARDPGRPVLHLNAEGEARYEQVDQILAQIGRAGVTRVGFVNNQQFQRNF